MTHGCLSFMGGDQVLNLEQEQRPVGMRVQTTECRRQGPGRGFSNHVSACLGAVVLLHVSSHQACAIAQQSASFQWPYFMASQAPSTCMAADM